MNHHESSDEDNFMLKPLDLDPSASNDSSLFFFEGRGTTLMAAESISHVIFRDVVNNQRHPNNEMPQGSNNNRSSSSSSSNNNSNFNNNNNNNCHQQISSSSQNFELKKSFSLNPSASTGFLRRANPIREKSSQSSDADDQQILQESPSRVISPYPFSHTSQEEMEDREQLTTTGLGWSLHGDKNFEVEDAEDDDEDDELNVNLNMNHNIQNITFQVDYSHFFEQESFVPIEQEVVMECDDFSLSTAHTLLTNEDDLSFGDSLDDPTSFWVDPALRATMSSTTSNHSLPTQVSIETRESDRH